MPPRRLAAGSGVCGAGRALPRVQPVEWLRWSRVCEIVEFEPPHRITWRTVATRLFPDSADWIIALERSGTRTRVVQTYRMRSTPAWFRWLVGRLVPAHLDRSGDLTGDLRRLGAIAARDAHAAATRP